MDAKRQTFQFKVVLRDVEPPVWRRIEVPASYSFWDLHAAIQDAMGWQDSHLHAFRLRHPQTGETDEIGIPDPDGFGPAFLAGWEIPVADYFRNPGDQAEYDYDFGDDWAHELTLEAVGIRHAKTKYPRCTDGARACPPEDCGGPHGYGNLLAALADTSHEEHEELLAWLGGPFDTEAFEPAHVRFDNPQKRWRIAFSDE